MASKPKQRGDKKGNASEVSKGFTADKQPDASRLPFEPPQNKKKPVKKEVVQKANLTSPKQSSGQLSDRSNSPAKTAFSGIPESVSKRMAKRAALFCGIPTSLGMLTFVISYLVVINHVYKLPTVVVLLVSLGFFGLGVLGLSYGAFSASWDEGRLGHWFGWSEFRTNFGRTIASWKAAQQKNLEGN
jgi:Photosynthesis affected mutant 68